MGKLADALEKASKLSKPSPNPKVAQDSVSGGPAKQKPHEPEPLQKPVITPVPVEDERDFRPRKEKEEFVEEKKSPVSLRETTIRAAEAEQRAKAQPIRSEPDTSLGSEAQPEVRIAKRFKEKEGESRKTIYQSPDPLSLTNQTANYGFSEQFKLLRTFLIHRPSNGAAPRTIMVTSSGAGEGKTMVAVNLAISIAMGMEEHVLLVDADMRLPSIDKFLGMKTDLGLIDYLTRDDLDLNQVLYKSPVEKLKILPSGGEGSYMAPELLASDKMKRLVAEVRNRYDDRFIIFDTPPVSATVDPSVLSKEMDAVLFVVRYGFTSKKVIEAALNRVGREKVKGVVFNCAKEENQKSKYQYNYNYRAYENPSMTS